jgi:hypothetical protein
MADFFTDSLGNTRATYCNNAGDCRSTAATPATSTLAAAPEYPVCNCYAGFTGYKCDSYESMPVPKDAGAGWQLLAIKIVWGVRDQYDASFNNAGTVTAGTPVYDTTFDLSSPNAQRSMDATCAALRSDPGIAQPNIKCMVSVLACTQDLIIF